MIILSERTIYLPYIPHKRVESSSFAVDNHEARKTSKVKEATRTLSQVANVYVVVVK